MSASVPLGVTVTVHVPLVDPAVESQNACAELPPAIVPRDSVGVGVDAQPLLKDTTALTLLAVAVKVSRFVIVAVTLNLPPKLV